MATSPYFSRIRTPSDDRSRNASVLPKLSSQGNLIAGATARVGIGFLLNPFSVLKARFEVCMVHFLVMNMPLTAPCVIFNYGDILDEEQYLRV